MQVQILAGLVLQAPFWARRIKQTESSTLFRITFLSQTMQLQKLWISDSLSPCSHLQNQERYVRLAHKQAMAATEFCASVVTGAAKYHCYILVSNAMPRKQEAFVMFAE